MEYSIRIIEDRTEKPRIARAVLEALPEWFGIPEAREKYINVGAEKPFIAAFDGERPIGFLYLAKTGSATVELHCMGVLKEYHRMGVGRALVDKAVRFAVEAGYAFMQVKTVQSGFYEEYDRTNAFYKACGFSEFEVFPELWGEANPCQVYVMSLK
ncbi:MAG: GNAT family N-acetyltransferase [Clostridia bacterium]|nr:GNAT family N-acetyltransferase [Clostridia bacterium]